MKINIRYILYINANVMPVTYRIKLKLHMYNI